MKAAIEIIQSFLKWFESYSRHPGLPVVPRSAAIGARWPTFEKFSTIKP